MGLFGTIAGIDKNGNPYMEYDEKHPDSYVTLDFDKDGTIDATLSIPKDTNILKTVYNLETKDVENYDTQNNKIIDTPDNPDNPDNTTDTNNQNTTENAEGCSYSSQNNTGNAVFLLLFMVLVLLKTKKRIS